MPPAAPIPITMKSTTSFGRNCAALISSLDRYSFVAACGLGIVISERRLITHLMIQTDQLPSNHSAVAAMHRMAQESERGMRSDLLEEIRLLHGLQKRDLLFGAKRGDRFRPWKQTGALGLCRCQPLAIKLLLISIVSGQRTIDEPDHASGSGARRIVVGNDLRSDRLDLGRSLRIKVDQLRRSLRRRIVLLRAQDLAPAGRSQHPLTPGDAHDVCSIISPRAAAVHCATVKNFRQTACSFQRTSTR